MVLAGAAMAGLLAPGGAAAQPFEVGQWQGNAFFAKDTNAFVRCVVRGRPQNRVTVEFGLTASRALEIWLSSGEWRLKKGDRYPVSFWIDDGPHLSASATVATDSMVRIDVGSATPVFDRLKQGAQLFVATASDTKVFKLQDSARALERLRGCVEGYAPARPATPPASVAAAPSKALPETNPFAPRQDDMAATFADYGRWHVGVGAITRQLYGLFGILGEVDRLAEQRDGDEITNEAARSKANAVLAKFRDDFARVSAALDRMRPYDGPYVQGRGQSRTLLRHFASMRDQLANMAVEVEQSFKAVIEGDKAAHARVMLRVLDRFVALLKLENVTIELGNLALETDHPQHSLQLANVRANEALIEILLHMKELAASEQDQTHVAAAATALSRMAASISEGRGKIDQAKQSIRLTENLTRDQRRILDEAIDTYHDSFLVEERISGVLRLTLASLPDTRAQALALGTDTKALFSKSQAALTELVNQRLALQQKRSELIAGLR